MLETLEKDAFVVRSYASDPGISKHRAVSLLAKLKVRCNPCKQTRSCRIRELGSGIQRSCISPEPVISRLCMIP